MIQWQKICGRVLKYSVVLVLSGLLVTVGCESSDSDDDGGIVAGNWENSAGAFAFNLQPDGDLINGVDRNDERVKGSIDGNRIQFDIVDLDEDVITSYEGTIISRTEIRLNGETYTASSS